MTDEQITAKNWLMRVNDYAEKVKAERRTLEMLQTRLYKGVSNYDGFTGRKDPSTARAAREDALIDFSEQSARVEKAQKEYITELEITREVLELIPLRLQALAIDRYINGYKWRTLEDLHHYGKSTLLVLNAEILSNVAQILKAKQTPLKTNTKPQEATA